MQLKTVDGIIEKNGGSSLLVKHNGQNKILLKYKDNVLLLAELNSEGELNCETLFNFNNVSKRNIYLRVLRLKSHKFDCLRKKENNFIEIELENGYLRAKDKMENQHLEVFLAF